MPIPDTWRIKKEWPSQPIQISAVSIPKNCKAFVLAEIGSLVRCVVIARNRKEALNLWKKDMKEAYRFTPQEIETIEYATLQEYYFIETDIITRD